MRSKKYYNIYGYVPISIIQRMIIMIILTDSTAGIRGEELISLGIKMIPLNVNFGEKTFQDSVNLMPDDFYQMLETSKKFPITSQPSPNSFLEIFEDAKEQNEDLIYLAISSGLSGTINSARIAKDMAEYDRIFIVDTKESIQGLRLLVLHACKLRDEGKTAEEIVNEIEHLKNHVHICSMINTLEYLYRGGRLSKAKAIAGNLLNLKPMVDLDLDGKIRMYGTSIGVSRALISIMKKLKDAPINVNYPVCFGYTYGQENMLKLIEKVKAEYHIENYDISQVGPAIGSHIGIGGLCMMYISDKERD